MSEKTTAKKASSKAKKTFWDEYMNEYVQVFVPMVPGGPNEPLLLIHNGRAVIFDRGKTHRMKRYLAKIFQDSMDAQQVQYLKIQKLENETAAALANPSVIS